MAKKANKAKKVNKASKKGNWKATAKKWFKIVAGVLAGVLSLTGVISIAKHVNDKYSSDTYVFTEKNYTTAGYIDEYGKYMSFENAGQTNYNPQLTNDDFYDMYQLQSVTYEADKEYPIGGFQINLYDEDKTLVTIHDTELTEEQVRDYIEKQGIKWFRVEIIPKNDDDGVINKGEMNKCTKQVVVTMMYGHHVLDSETESSTESDSAEE